jgi:hypothetical protein
MKAGEERFVLECLHDERVHFLLERQLHADADRPRCAGDLRALVGNKKRATPKESPLREPSPEP